MQRLHGMCPPNPGSDRLTWCVSVDQEMASYLRQVYMLVFSAGGMRGAGEGVSGRSAVAAATFATQTARDCFRYGRGCMPGCGRREASYPLVGALGRMCVCVCTARRI